MKKTLKIIWATIVAVGAICMIFVALDSFERHYMFQSTDLQPSEYSNSYVYECHTDYIRLKDSKTGKYLTPKLDRVYRGGILDTLTVFTKDGKRGFLNGYTGKIEIPAQYERAWVFSEGMGAVVKGGNLGFVNKKGESVIPFKFFCSNAYDNSVDYLFKGGLCTIADSTGKHGLIDKSGNWVLTPKYDYIQNPKKGYRVVSQNNKYALMDSTLSIVMPFEYELIDITDEGIVTLKDGLPVLYALDGKTKINQFIYTEISSLYYPSKKYDGETIEYTKSDFSKFGIGDKYGVIDKNGKLLIKAKYSDINAISDKLFSCKAIDSDYLSIINSKGELVK